MYYEAKKFFKKTAFWGPKKNPVSLAEALGGNLLIQLHCVILLILWERKHVILKCGRSYKNISWLIYLNLGYEMYFNYWFKMENICMNQNTWCNWTPTLNVELYFDFIIGFLTYKYSISNTIKSVTRWKPISILFKKIEMVFW